MLERYSSLYMYIYNIYIIISLSKSEDYQLEIVPPPTHHGRNNTCPTNHPSWHLHSEPLLVVVMFDRKNPAPVDMVLNIQLFKEFSYMSGGCLEFLSINSTFSVLASFQTPNSSSRRLDLVPCAHFGSENLTCRYIWHSNIHSSHGIKANFNISEIHLGLVGGFNPIWNMLVKFNHFLR